MTVGRYQQKDSEIEAIRFKGFASAVEIFTWGADVFYVPKGQDHHLRTENERKSGVKSVLDNAPEFLVLHSPLFGEVRVNKGDVITKSIHTGHYRKCTKSLFRSAYVLIKKGATSTNG